MTAPPYMLTTSFPNLREVAGLPGQGGRPFAAGRLYRSEMVLLPLDHEAEVLRGLGVRTVFDLRGPDERDRAPNDWWRAQGVRIDEVDLAADVRNKGDHRRALLEDPEGDGAERMMFETYRSLPGAILPHLDRLFTDLTDGSGAVLAYCGDTTDRT